MTPSLYNRERLYGCPPRVDYPDQIIPSKGIKSAANRRVSQNKAPKPKQIIQNIPISEARQTATNQDDFDIQDLSRSRRSLCITQTPPKSLSNQIFWTKLVYTKVVAFTASANIEVPISFRLSDFPGSSDFRSGFDEYCLYAVSVSATVTDLLFSSSVSQDSIRYASAIDYDNVGTGYGIGIQNYSSYKATMLSPTNSQTRMIQPCVAAATYAAGSLGPNQVARVWLDSTYTGVDHYGYKGLYYQDSFASGNISLLVTAWVGWRVAV
jgi:hypothetical protein